MAVSGAKKVIIIAGPTAAGKTGVAIQVAKALGTEIISADSRQCFRELSIGVARPTKEELAAVPHHFIASNSIHEKITAATFEDYALMKTAELFAVHDHVVIVGGTGLYLKAFAAGMDPIPEVAPQVHLDVVEGFREKGLPWLQQQVAARDPLFFSQGEIQNPQRMMRALEVVLSTGQSVLTFRSGERKQRPFRIVKMAIDIPKEILHQNINARVNQMMEAGLLDEVRSLTPYQHLNALQTVGYKELFSFLNGHSTLEAAVGQIKQNTRQYAKRQLTWFRKDKEYQWVPPDAGFIIGQLTNE